MAELVAVHARFWDFVAERQRVFQRRRAGEKPPWTEDSVLQKARFTNVYRELDPGTQFAVEHILNRDATDGDIFFNLMFYRLVGKEQTYQATGFLLPEKPDTIWAAMGAMLRLRDEQGEAPFTGAYMVNSYSKMATGDKVLNVGRLLLNAAAEWPKAWQLLRQRSVSRQAVLESLGNMYGWGPFLAYQVVVDASYPRPDPLASAADAHTGESSVLGEGRGNNGQVVFGPGALRGFQRLFPASDASGSQPAMQVLWENQWEELNRRNFHWLLDRNGDPHRLTRANLANCLCEFDKYCRYTDDSGVSKRRFDPVEAYRRDRDARGHGEQFNLWQGVRA